MRRDALNIVVLGLSLSSSWGNGHATTYRALLKALAARGHDILFLERDVPWYAAHRDLTDPAFCQLRFYSDLTGLHDHRDAIANADAVIVGSYVPEGVAVGRWVQETARGVTAFYDIDTPVTLAKLERGDYEYLSPDLIPGYDLYLSFTGGPTLDRLMRRYGAPAARALYCSVDPDAYPPLERPKRWDLSYHRHLQPRPAAEIGAPADRAGAAGAAPPIRRSRAAISERHRLAGQRGAHRPCSAGRPPRLLCGQPVYAERDPRRHDQRPATAPASGCSKPPPAARP